MTPARRHSAAVAAHRDDIGDMLHGGFSAAVAAIMKPGAVMVIDVAAVEA